MKPTFKTTALVILVSLGVAACSSSSKDDFNPNMIKDKVKAKVEEKAKDVVEQAKESVEEKAKEAVENVKKEEATNTAYQYSDNIKNKEGNEWRLVDTSIHRSGHPRGYEYNVTGFDELGDGDSSLEVNFNQLSNNQLGKFSGTTEGEFLLWKPSNTLDYTFVNQPYSTYGVVTDVNGHTDTFAIIQRADKSSSLESYGITLISNWAEYEVIPKGSATYKGDAFEYVRYDYKDSGAYKRLVTEDGSFTLTADFDKSTVSGTLNSNTLGEIKLFKSNLGTHFSSVGGRAYVGDETGNYAVQFGGKDLNDVVGTASFQFGSYSNKTITVDGKEQYIYSYNAAFGGTKQK